MSKEKHEFMRQLSILVVATASFFAVTALPAAGADLSLTYSQDLKGPAPIPASERSLPTAVAEPYFKVSDKALQLEGAVFDRQNNLYFVDVFSGSVFKLTPDKKLSTILGPNQTTAAGLAIHKDGRIFVGGLGDTHTTGTIVAINPDGSGMETIVPKGKYSIDDMIFDKDGGLYFTDFKGSSTEPTGGLYYVSPDLKTVTSVDPNMGIANGVGISPDGKKIYITESSKLALHAIEIATPTTIAPFGDDIILHYFDSYVCDSLRMDADGNVYVAMYGQGRWMVLNKMGRPIGQILLPDRDDGHWMRTTSLAFKPGTNDIYIVASDADGSPVQGAMVFHAKGFAKGIALFSHQ